MGWVREAEGESMEKTLAKEGQNEELKNISFETSPPVVPYSLFSGLLVGFSSSSCVVLKPKHLWTFSGVFQTMSYRCQTML